MTDGKQGDKVQGPAFKFEWNLNTIATLLGFGVMIFGSGVAWANIDAKFSAMNTWVGGHEQLHKDRQSEITGDTRAADERIRSVETRLGGMDNLTYRITVNEQSTAATAQVLKEVQAVVNKQAVDQATMLAILNRIDTALRSSGNTPRLSQ